MKFRNMFLVLITFGVFVLTFGSCGKDDPAATSAAATGPLPTFSTDLEELMPKAAATSSSKGFSVLKNLIRNNKINKDSYSQASETYAQAIAYGGMIDRALGQSDPLTIWMNLDLAETFGELISDGTIPLTAESLTLTMPMAIDGAADTLEVTHTFNSGNDTIAYEDTANSFYCDLTKVKGGFTDIALMFTFNVVCYGEEARENVQIDARFIFYANKESGNDGLVLKASRFENEGGDATRISRAFFSFNENRSGDYIKYRVVSNYSWDKSTAFSDINLVQTTIMSGSKEKFLIRKRSMNNCNHGVSGASCDGAQGGTQYGKFADEFFAVDFVPATGAFGASAIAAANVDGTTGSTDLVFTSGDTGGLGNLIDANDNGSFTTSNYATINALNYGDFSYLASTNMYNINNLTAILPQARSDLDVDW